MGTEPDLRKPYILQLGLGTDLEGGDVTKAARRAVEDAMARNRLLFRSQGEFEDTPLAVRVTVAVPNPEAVDVEAVRSAIPEGEVTVVVKEGGLEAYTGLEEGPVMVAVASVRAGSDA